MFTIYLNRMVYPSRTLYVELMLSSSLKCTLLQSCLVEIKSLYQSSDEATFKIYFVRWSTGCKRLSMLRKNRTLMISIY
ncbi:MAG: hypothetical protein ACTS45_00385 [Candidatus Hodgkinia cicadicola]